MFQEEMNKIREAELEADRRRDKSQATVRAMKEEAEMRHKASLEEAKKTATRIREDRRAEAEQKASHLKDDAARQAEAEAQKLRADAETRLKEAVILITEGVGRHGSR